MNDAQEALQDLVDADNPCFGCGPANPVGLRIKSYPADDGEGLVATWTGEEHHAGSAGVLGGGVQATLMDCHGIWTAVHWHARTHGGERVPHYVTAELHVAFRRPAPLMEPVTLRSRVEGAEGRRVRVAVELSDQDGEVCSTAEVVCHRLDEAWGPNPVDG